MDKTIVVPYESAGMRFDLFVFAALEKKYSRSKVKAAIDEGHIRLGDARKPAHYLVKALDRIVITDAFVTHEPDASIIPQDIPIRILYEDEYLVAIDKPAGMVVHPGAGNMRGTLANALAFYYQTLSHLSGELRPGIVHRLDKDTSGVIVIAKNDEVHRRLGDAFKERTIHKTYRAIVKGIIEHDEGVIDASIARKPGERKKMHVAFEEAKEATTHYKVVERFAGKGTFVEAHPITGRTHQLRVHFRYLGHPIWGDRPYGGPPYKRLLLHACSIRFIHPMTQRELFVESALPKEFDELMASWRRA